MNERIEQELAILRRRYPALEYRDEAQWVLIPHYTMPAEMWNYDEVAVAFQIPLAYPTNKPYGFYVRPRVTLKDGRTPNNTTASAEPPFDGEWLKFSWDLPEWRPTADVQSGTNLLNFVLTFQERLKEGF